MFYNAQPRDPDQPDLQKLLSLLPSKGIPYQDPTKQLLALINFMKYAPIKESTKQRILARAGITLGRQQPLAEQAGGVVDGLRVAGIGQGYLSGLGAQAARQQQVVGPQQRYQSLLQAIENQKALQQLSLRGRQSQAEVDLERRKAEFQKALGKLDIKDIQTQANANLWNNLLAGIGNAVGSYWQLQQQNKMAGALGYNPIGNFPTSPGYVIPSWNPIYEPTP